MFPAKYGAVHKIWRADDSRFVLLFEDNPANGDIGIRIHSALSTILSTRITSLVGIDGAFGPVDTRWFRAFPGEDIRKETGEYFVKNLGLRGAEFCHIVFDEPFELWGVDDRELYVEALHVWRSNRVDEFIQLQKKRAYAILGNFIRRMCETESHVGALTICGNLAGFVATEAGAKGYSYAIIRPAGISKSVSSEQTATPADLRTEDRKAICCNVLTAVLIWKADEQLSKLPEALDEFGYPNYDPDAAAEWVEQGQASYLSQDYEKAIGYLGRAVQMYSILYKSHQEKICLLQESREAEEADRFQARAQLIARIWATAEYNLGIALWDSGKYDGAEAHWNKAVEINPRFERAWANKGVAMIRRAEYEAAVECCDKAIELNPEFPDSWYNKWSALVHLGKPGEAEPCLRTFERLKAQAQR